MSITDYLAAALSQTSSGYCFVLNPARLKFENAVNKLPGELADDFAQVFRQSQHDVNVFTVCLRDSVLPGYINELIPAIAEQIQARLRIFACQNGELFLLNKTIESRANEPAKCTLEMLKDGVLQIRGAENYIEEDYALAAQLDFGLLNMQPQCVLFDFSAERRFMRFYVVLVGKTVLSLNDLKANDPHEIQDNFKLGREYLFLIPFLQSAGFFKDISFCSFYDDLTKFKTSDSAGPLLAMLTRPSLFAKIFFGLHNALNALLFDAFYMRRGYVFAFVSDYFNAPAGGKGEDKADGKAGENKNLKSAIYQSLYVKVATTELDAVAEVLLQICVGVARGSCMLSQKDVNTDNIVLARSRFLFELVQKKLSSAQAKEPAGSNTYQLVRFETTTANRTRTASPLPTSAYAVAKPQLKSPLQQLKQLGATSFDEEIIELYTYLAYLGQEEVELKSQLENSQNDLRRAYYYDQQMGVQSYIQVQIRLQSSVAAIKQQIYEFYYVNNSLVREIAYVDRKIEAARYQAVYQPGQSGVRANEEQLMDFAVSQERARIDSELRQQYEEKLAALARYLQNAK